MGQVPLAGLLAVFTGGRVSAIFLITGGLAAIIGVLRIFGIVPRLSIGRNLDPRIQGLVAVLIGVALVVLGLVLR